VVIWNVHPNPVVRGGWEAQRASLSLVADQVAAEDRPTIVLGDFNTTDQTANYRLVADRLIDVHQAVGRGFGFTFPDFSQARSLDLPWYTGPLLAAGPVVRIDHIFASQHFVPRQAFVVPVASGSDHRPVIATLSWRDEV
jgi:endonuclease/exonuclease/phosphatase family metal-dependent hydrolase